MTTQQRIELLDDLGRARAAKQLHLSVKTVEAHRSDIKLKLNLSSASDLLQCAIAWARQMGGI